MRVLVVDGDDAAGRVMADYLRAHAIMADAVASGVDAVDMCRHYEFDAVFIAGDPEDMHCGSLLGQLRRSGNHRPVLMALPDATGEQRVACLDAGADDVTGLPCGQVERLARVRAVVRRSNGHSSQRLSVGPLVLDVGAFHASVHGVEIHLTPKEMAVCTLLATRRGTLVTKASFLDHLYGGQDEPEVKIIDVFVCKLRKKLADAGAPGMISTVWGRGYIMQSVPPPAGALAAMGVPVVVPDLVVGLRDRRVPDCASA